MDVFRDDRRGVPPAERWKALVNEAGGDHIWVSADAIHFTRHGNKSKPVLIGADTQVIPCTFPPSHKTKRESSTHELTTADA